MLNRLKQHVEHQDSTCAAQDCKDRADDMNASFDPEAVTGDLSSLGVLKLRQECKKRGLALYGTKDGACFDCNIQGLYLHFLRPLLRCSHTIVLVMH